MRRLTVISLALLAFWPLGCSTPPSRTPVRVTYTFENMRRFVDAGGAPISYRDEWALVEELKDALGRAEAEDRVRLIAIAGANGSLGDLSQVELLGAGILLAAVISAFAGWAMMHSLRRVDAERRSRLDAWAAFLVGLALFIFLITLVPALILLALMPDENQSLNSQIEVHNETATAGNDVPLLDVDAFMSEWAGRRRRPGQRGSNNE